MNGGKAYYENTNMFTTCLYNFTSFKNRRFTVRKSQIVSKNLANFVIFVISTNFVILVNFMILVNLVILVKL